MELTYPKAWTWSLPLCPLIFSWSELGLQYLGNGTNKNKRKAQTNRYMVCTCGYGYIFLKTEWSNASLRPVVNRTTVDFRFSRLLEQLTCENFLFVRTESFQQCGASYGKLGGNGGKGKEKERETSFYQP